MKNIKIIRSYIFYQLYKLFYSITKKEKTKQKLKHYRRKYSILSTKTVSYKEFRDYIKKRENLSIYDYEEIASPLPFHVQSSELWGWNDFYGTAEIYKKYAGYPLDYQVKFVIDHSIHFWIERYNNEEYSVNLPAHIATSEFAKEQIEKHVKTMIFPTGLHMFYAEDYYDDNKFKTEKEKLGKNLLVFPSHSSDVCIAEFDPEPLIKEILATKERGNFNSVTVCFYFADIQRKFHKKFEGHGFKFVTAGHILDPKFISRLKTIIKLSDVTMSNGIGSHIFYSIGFDKPHYMIEENNYKYIDTANDKQGNIQEKTEGELLYEPSVGYYRNIFKDYTESLTKEQLEIKNKICGIESKRTKEEICNFFKETEEIYKKGSYLSNEKPYTHIFTLMQYLDNEK